MTDVGVVDDEEAPPVVARAVSLSDMAVALPCRPCGMSHRGPCVHPGECRSTARSRAFAVPAVSLSSELEDEL